MIKHFIKSKVSKFLLRGAIRERWIREKTRRIERTYLKELIKRSDSGSHAPPQSRPLPVAKKPLNSILFIADILWEDKELIPELEKIAPVEVLNLRTHFKNDPKYSHASDEVVQILRDFIDKHDTPNFSCVFLYLRSGLLSTALFELIRSHWDCILLGMNLDDKLEFLDYGQFSYGRENYRQWLQAFDVNITNVRAVVDWYQQENAAVYYMPEGFHPRADWERPQNLDMFHRELAFVGSWKPERALFFRELQSMGIPLEPIGYGWPNSKGGKNPIHIYRTSMLNLGIGFASPSETLTTLKTRDFECPGSGACYITTYNWELSLHYDIGREILCYRGMEELVEMISFYRRHPQQCLEIAQRAWDRCQQDHTWEKRFRDLFIELGL